MQSDSQPEAPAYEHSRARPPASAFDSGTQLDESVEQTHDVEGLVPCEKCGRKFAADRVSKHERVCKVNEYVLMTGNASLISLGSVLCSTLQCRGSYRISNRYSAEVGAELPRRRLQDRHLQPRSL